MPRRSREIESVLRKKGFAAKETHHTQMWLVVDGKKSSVHTFLSHDGKEYGASLLGKMAKQLHLDRARLDLLLDCPMTEADYLAHLRANGVLGPRSE